MTNECCLIESLPYSAEQPFHIFNVMNKFAIIIFEKHKSFKDNSSDLWETCEISCDLTITDLFILINKNQSEDDFKLRCSQFNESMDPQDVFHIQVGQNVGGWESGWKDWRKSESIKNILISESDTDYIIQFFYKKLFGNFEYAGYNEQLHTISITKEPISDDISSIIRRKIIDISEKELGTWVFPWREPLLEVVDKQDRLIQYETKKEVHISGLLHRAFSVFLYDRSKRAVLIQRRALEKYHSGGFWSNSCCSHKYQNETWEESVARCLRDELSLYEKNAGAHIRHLGTFSYFSDYGDNKEHEIDRVFIYTPNAELCSQIKPNPNEIMDIKWMTIEEIDAALKTNPKSFTSWFSEAYSYFRSAVPEIFS